METRDKERIERQVKKSRQKKKEIAQVKEDYKNQLKAEDKLDKLFMSAYVEEEFEKTPAFEIANYFKEILKKAGFSIMSDKNWDKTKEAAIKIILTGTPSVEVCKEAIDWTFSDERFADKYLGKFVVKHFGVVVRVMLDTYLNIKNQNASKKPKRIIDYGEL